MASLRVFVSSTCYDLSSIRSHLRQFIITMGHQPMMSDYNDILYDPRTHTHTSCVEEIKNADYIVLIIGGRYGGNVLPDALNVVDFDELKKQSGSKTIFDTKEKLSITQLEILKAIENEIPIITFVDSRVMNDHATYEKNKTKSISKDIEYASIEKPHTASFIFEFINFLRKRSYNNTLHTFSRPEEIESTLRTQWSGLLQRLLYDERTKITERKEMENFSTQIEDLKTAILASIGGGKIDKEVAKGVVVYRKLVDFIRGFALTSYDFIYEEDMNFDQFLEKLDIVKIVKLPPLGRRKEYNFHTTRDAQALIKSDGTFYLVTNLYDIDYMRIEFNNFMRLSRESRKIIFDSLIEINTSEGILFRNFLHISNKTFSEFKQELEGDAGNIKSENDKTQNDD